MKNPISILVVVDCESILKAIKAENLTTGTVGNPTPIADTDESNIFAYVIAPLSFGTNDADSPVVSVKAHLNEKIMWRTSCIGQGVDYNVILDNIVPIVHKPVKEKIHPVIRNLKSVPVQINNYAGATETYTDFAFTGKVLSGGVFTYNIVFQVLDNQGKGLGYYSWENTLKVVLGWEKVDSGE
jgi:Inclusion body protein